MYIHTQKEFKQSTSALRKSLKNLFPDLPLSHAQSLELMAQALGKSSYAELLVELPVDRPQQASESTPVLAPVRPRFPLLNLSGALDLADKGDVRVGFDFGEMQGIVEDIMGSIALTGHGARRKSGLMVATDCTETRVNWDSQAPRRAADGQLVWLAEDGNTYSGTACLLVPEEFYPYDEDHIDNLPLRQDLMNAYQDLAKERNCVEALLNLDLDEAEFDDLLGELARTIGFALHLGELKALQRALQSN